MSFDNELNSVPESISRDGLALIKGEERRVNLDDVMGQLGVYWTIRLHEKDFISAKHSLELNGVFTHFNLGNTLHEVGKLFAVVPILRTSVKPPLVDYTRAVTVICSRVLNEVDYSTISNNDFKHSLPNVMSRLDLERVMCERYCAVRNLTEEDVLKMPITLTEVRRI